MMPLAQRLAPSRFLDPALMGLVALGVLLYLAFREAPARAAAGKRLRVAVWTAWAGLWALSTPVVSNQLNAWTEIQGPDLGVALAGKDPERVALVVLGAGIRTFDESSPPRERLDAAGTQRALTASRLWHERRFGLVIVSGAPKEAAEDMADLILYLGVPPEKLIVEDRSLNTRENAIFSAGILREKGMASTVVVLTSATHLRRSLKDFATVGIAAIPAAADVVGHPRSGIDGFLPSSTALARSHFCLHEILGYVRG
jgi:uncharacterized SAM-binding protein YcdF (DUF218 family)